MILRKYVIKDIYYDDAFKHAIEELRGANQVVMKLGYPDGKDTDECLVIYALYSNQYIF